MRLRLTLGFFSSALVLVSGTNGCLGQSDCENEDIRCDGTVAHLCVTSNAMFGGLEKETRDCANTSQVCVVVTEDGRRDALCVESASSDQRCPASGSSAICVGNERLTCSSSYLVDHQDCGSDTCKQFDFTAGCVDPSDPCADMADGWLCEGDEARACSYGTTSRVEDCPGCYLNDAGHPLTSMNVEYPGCG